MQRFAPRECDPIHPFLRSRRRTGGIRRQPALIASCAGIPTKGAARCPDCARRSYVRSPEHRGLPVSAPRFTVIEIDTGACHGSFDSEAEVTAHLVFAKLGHDQVEIVSDTSAMTRYAAWSWAGGSTPGQGAAAGGTPGSGTETAPHPVSTCSASRRESAAASTRTSDPGDALS